MGKCNKIHGMGKVWKIDNHTFPIAWVHFSHPIPILWDTSAYGKCMGFPINFPQHGKMHQNPWYGENLGNWHSYFSHSMGAFFRLDSHSMVYFIICEIHWFPLPFSVAWENAVKSIELGEPRNLVPIFPLTYGQFSSIRFPFYGIFCYHRGNAWFFPLKSTLRALW